MQQDIIDPQLYNFKMLKLLRQKLGIMEQLALATGVDISNLYKIFKEGGATKLFPTTKTKIVRAAMRLLDQEELAQCGVYVNLIPPVQVEEQVPVNPEPVSKSIANYSVEDLFLELAARFSDISNNTLEQKIANLEYKLQAIQDFLSKTFKL